MCAYRYTPCLNEATSKPPTDSYAAQHHTHVIAAHALTPWRRHESDCNGDDDKNVGTKKHVNFQPMGFRAGCHATSMITPDSVGPFAADITYIW